MLPALVLTLLQGLAPCPACSVEGKEAHLCAPHADEEKQVLARAAKRSGSKDPDERAAALDELARLTHAHANAPSRRVAERLCSAFDDDSYAVRRHAAELLGPPQHAEAALSGLLEALRSAENERLRLEKERQKLRTKQAGSPRPRESQMAQLKSAEAENVAQGAALLLWRAAVLEQLGTLPDDRVVDAILELTPRDLALGGNEALLRLGRRDGLEALVESLRVFEERLVAAEKEVAEQEQQLLLLKQGDRPKAVLDGSEYLLMLACKELADVKAAGDAHLPELVRIADERGLGPAPALGTRPHAPWKTWLAAHLAAAPTHLTGVSSPVRSPP